MRCDLQLCGYMNNTAGAMEVNPESRKQCNRTAFLLLIKSFNGDHMEQNKWINQKSTEEEIRKSCPVQYKVIEKYKSDLKDVLSKSQA